MKRIYYIGYYSDPLTSSVRKTAPAADTKMDYIINKMKEIGYEVNVLSFCEHDDRKAFFEKKPGYEIYKDGTRIVYFTNYTSRFRFLRVIGRIIAWRKIKRFLCEQFFNDECKIVIYHSLGLLKVINLLNKKKKAFILEVEEIYSDVGKTRFVKREKEVNSFSYADAYIFPTQLLDNAVNSEKKPSVKIHGTYCVEKECGQPFNDGRVHVVYAGTFDPRKGGVQAAAAAEYLTGKYHVHILGFGSETDKNNLLKTIEEVSRKTECRVTYDGLKSGKEYIKFIQSCDIGLSTQNPDAAFNATSFPSKILSYMANGLRVVSIRIPAIEQSAIGEYMYYYDKQTPEEIAKAIMQVDLNDGYDSRKIIERLDERFTREMAELLEKV